MTAVRALKAHRWWKVDVVATLTIRNLDDQVKAALRVRAAEHGRSMEAEAREILAQVVGSQGTGLGASMSARFAEFGDVDLVLPSRSDRARPADL